MIIDIHSHLTFPEFDADREEILEEMKQHDIATITVGTSYHVSSEAVKLAAAFQKSGATIGIHPTEQEIFDSSAFTNLITEQVVAVGECGLDYFRGRELEHLQRSNFEAQIDFARHHRLPLMIHARPTKSTSDAYHDVADMLIATASDWPSDVPRGDMHFFSGDIDSARRLLDAGMTLSFDGPITFTHEYDEVIAFTPLDRIHAETDAPFAAPAPYRGKRCSPLMVIPIIERIAVIKGQSFEDLKITLEQNAFQTFPGLVNALR